MKYFIALSVLLFSLCGHAQLMHRGLHFNLEMEGQSIEVGKKYYSSFMKDSVHFEVVKFYISNLQFFQDQQMVAALEKKYLLIDAEKSASMSISLPKVAFNKIKFNIGIDSLTNVSGAFGGDLDPTKGMYWTWQSGYINFKLEGITESCPASNNLFQFHLGGYQYPFNALQKIVLDVKQVKGTYINVAIDELLAQINLQKTYQVMSPNQKALEVSELLPSIFSIQRN
jgi:hypothetical protein